MCREALDSSVPAADIEPDAEEHEGVQHKRLESDDAETDALLAAAVAKMDGTTPDSQPKSRRGIPITPHLRLTASILSSTESLEEEASRSDAFKHPRCCRW